MITNHVERGAATRFPPVGRSDRANREICDQGAEIDFAFGHCRMMLISAPGQPRLTTIATKYPRITRQYLDARGLRAEIVPLAGSVELAAVLALTSHVVDLVETGETVRVNKLEIQDLVAEISPRLIVGRNAYRTNGKQVRELIARVEAACNATVQS